jgi:phenylacetate-coenzyme A ligase PaaK-like adenylate-forming protein
VHATSGTHGRPTIVGYTAGDLEVFATVVSRALRAAGAQRGTVVHNAYGYGLFTGGLGLHGGAERLGCTVVPVSGGQTERQLTLLRDLGPEVLCCTPSYAALLGESAAAAGLSPEQLSLRVGIFGAEPWTEQLRARIEALLGITALDIYGLCEVIGPGVSFECLASRAEVAAGGPGGSHVNEDHFLVECVNPADGEPVPDGSVGELVFTTLTRAAMPLLRYRSGDLATLHHQRCGCGRTTVRMSRVLGRRDDMLVVRGVNVYPSEVEAVLLGAPDLAPHYALVVDTRPALATLTVVAETLGADDAPARAVRGQQLAAGVRERLGVSARVVVGPAGTLPRTEVGKAVRVVHRNAEVDGLPAGLRALLDGPPDR